MKKNRESFAKRMPIACVGTAALVVAGGILLCIFGRGATGEPETPPAAPPKPPVEIALANRTLCATGFPVRFCEHQTASVRGSAPYVLALTNGASKAEAIVAVRNCGARVIGPLPPNALLVETSIFSLGKLSQVALFAAASEWLPEDKVDAQLKPLLDSRAATLDVTVVALAPADVEGLVDLAVQKGGACVEGCLNGRSSVTLTLPRTIVLDLAKRGDVRWLEPFERPKLLNDQAVVPAAMNVQTVWNVQGLTGAGQLVTTSDSGIDTGDLATMHADLRNRLAGFRVVDGCYTYDANGHGTHTAGSIVGDGTMSGGQIRGVASGAKLWAWFCGGTDGLIYTPIYCEDLFRPSGATNACVHSASWGNDDKGAYSTKCSAMDEYVWEHPDFLPVIANGNEGGKGMMTVGSPATAKNVLSVGSTQSPRVGTPSTIASSSSRGPCADGRIKPDVCSPGVSIVSTRSYGATLSVYSANTNYAYMSGTSMATPLTAGAATLVRQWLVERRGFTNAVPTAALVKAVLTGGAKDVVTPNHIFGWGRVDLGESLYPSNRAVCLVDRVPFLDRFDSVACEVTLTNTAPFDVQLVWIDYPATAGAARTLVNDLDLIVSNKTTGAVWCGNGVAGGDHTNTVESVRIASAAPGDYAVIVRGADVSYASTQGGAAAVYVRGAFEEKEEKKELAIVAAEPSDANVAMSVGETNVFSVTVVASTNVVPVYAWMVDGVLVAGEQTNRFVYGTTRTDHGRHTVCAIVSASGGLFDNHGWIVTVHGEVHVDAATGDDATATGETDRPYASIAAALAKAVEGDIIRVGAGIYAGGLVAPVGAIRIVSEAGPESTIIDGGGTNRCFDASVSRTTVLSGFALMNGASTNNYGGGVLYGTLSNCVIRNCFAGLGGGGVCAATLTDCVIADCTTDGQGGGAYDSILVNCTVRDNQAGYWRTYYSWYYNCNFGGGVDCRCSCLNTIIWGNRRDDGTSDNWECCLEPYGPYLYEYHPDLLWCCTQPMSRFSSNCLTNDPWFVSADDATDPRLYEISPCIAAGKNGANIGAYRGTGVVKGLPAIDVKTATGEEISNAVASVGYVDPAVQAGIGTNGATYAAFAAWSTNGLKSTAVVYSSRAYDSFLVREIVAAPTLLGEGNETTVELTALEPASDGTCSTTLRLVDGETSVPLCAAKAAFAKHTQIGDDVTALAPADAVNVEAESVDGGRAVKLTLTPPISTLQYFMRFCIR